MFPGRDGGSNRHSRPYAEPKGAVVRFRQHLQRARSAIVDPRVRNRPTTSATASGEVALGVPRGHAVQTELLAHEGNYWFTQYSYHIPTNPHLTAHLLPIHAQLLDRLLERPNIAALLLVQHVLLNNIKIALKEHSSCIILEGLLGELTQIFTHGKL